MDASWPKRTLVRISTSGVDPADAEQAAQRDLESRKRRQRPGQRPPTRSTAAVRLNRAELGLSEDGDEDWAADDSAAGGSGGGDGAAASGSAAAGSERTKRSQAAAAARRPQAVDDMRQYSVQGQAALHQYWQALMKHHMEVRISCALALHECCFLHSSTPSVLAALGGKLCFESGCWSWCGSQQPAVHAAAAAPAAPAAPTPADGMRAPAAVALDASTPATAAPAAAHAAATASACHAAAAGSADQRQSGPACSLRVPSPLTVCAL